MTTQWQATSEVRISTRPRLAESARDRIPAMKAIVVREFGGPEVMKLEDAPAPVPGAGQVLRQKEAGIRQRFPSRPETKAVIGDSPPCAKLAIPSLPAVAFIV